MFDFSNYAAIEIVVSEIWLQLKMQFYKLLKFVEQETKEEEEERQETKERAGEEYSADKSLISAVDTRRKSCSSHIYHI